MLLLQVKIAKTRKEKILGLIGQPSPFPLLLRTRFGIHTFGVRFPIDVVVLDDRGDIASLKEGLRPNSFYFWNPKHSTVIELPNGTIAARNLQKYTKVKVLNSH